jgi:small-conductance mechanosensitive channel
MDFLHQIYTALPNLLLALSVIAMVLVFLWVANWILLRRNRQMGEERRFSRRITMLVFTVVGIVVVLLLLPVSHERRDQLVTLLGLILTAVIAIASTTFVANAMAGLMLRTVQAFRPGDFVRVGGHFGRVTERGLFHTEIQTEVKQLLTARSHVRSQILDTLHEAGIEIVSPAYMNQRRLGEKDRVLPPDSSLVSKPVEKAVDEVPEELIFDKAEEAERLEQLRLERDKLLMEITELENSLKAADGAERSRLESDLQRRRSRCEAIAREVGGEEK